VQNGIFEQIIDLCISDKTTFNHTTQFYQNLELHTKQFQIRMNSAVAAQFWAPRNAYMGFLGGDF